MAKQKAVHQLIHDKCSELADNDRYEECREFYRGKLKNSKTMVGALVKIMNKNVEGEIREKCIGVIRKDGGDGIDGQLFLDCSDKVSREYIKRIPEYVKFLYSVNEALRVHVKDF